MKRHILIIGIVALVLCMVYSSCKKYEEDYGLMMKSPKGRLVGTWKVMQLDSDTASLKLSDYAMFGELQMIFNKDNSGTVKFSDKGLGELLEDIDWEEMMGDMQDSTMNADSIQAGLEGLDFSSMLNEGFNFNWAFDDKKEYLKFKMYDSTSNAYFEIASMRILSLCKSDCKLRYEEDSTKVDISMQK